MDDLHRLDTSSNRWEEITTTKGVGPERRSGHQAQAVQTRLVVAGGKNSTTEFRDIHVLDTAADPPVRVFAGCCCAPAGGIFES